MQKAIWNNRECLIDTETEKLIIHDYEYTSHGIRIKGKESHDLSGFFMFAHPDISALDWFKSKDPEVILSVPLIYHKNDFTPLQKQLVKNIIESAVTKQMNRNRTKIRI
ncbi:MAG TPA: hypothetical protein PLQ61_06870 [Bacteroidales bacterium]|nr:hypothetical protein [Petrotogaceae bacterium]HQJ20899.1 hypothetical protein [Bacteroidales bacterium]